MKYELWGGGGGGGGGKEEVCCQPLKTEKNRSNQY